MRDIVELNGLQDIPSTLRAIRKKRGLTQKDVARMHGISQQCLSNLERNIALPSLRTMLRLAEIYAVGFLLVPTSQEGSYQ